MRRALVVVAGLIVVAGAFIACALIFGGGDDGSVIEHESIALKWLEI
jgi:hypothetical protein